MTTTKDSEGETTCLKVNNDGKCCGKPEKETELVSHTSHVVRETERGFPSALVFVPDGGQEWVCEARVSGVRPTSERQGIPRQEVLARKGGWCAHSVPQTVESSHSITA